MFGLIEGKEDGPRDLQTENQRILFEDLNRCCLRVDLKRWLTLEDMHDRYDPHAVTVLNEWVERRNV